MTHLQQGLLLVTKACELDHAGLHFDSLPLYRQAIKSFELALQGESNPTMKQTLSEKILLYKDRVVHIEKMPKIVNKEQEEVDQLIRQNIQSKTSSSDDKSFEDRIAKLRSDNKPPESTMDDLQERVRKLGGQGYVKHDIDAMIFEEQNETEDQKIEKLISQTVESVELDDISALHGYVPKPKSKVNKVKDKKEAKTKSETQPTPEKLNTEKGSKTHKKKSKKKPKNSSSSDEYSDSSEDISDDESLKIKDTDTDYQKREKAALRQMFLDQKKKKEEAYKQWKKNYYT